MKRFTFRILVIIAMLLANGGNKIRSESKTIHIDFSEWKLDVVSDELGNSSIISGSPEQPHYPDRNAPSLPWLAAYVDIENEKELESFTYDVSELKTLQGIRIYPVPKIIPTDKVMTVEEIKVLEEEMPINYPESNLRYLCIRSTPEGYNRLIFLVCPFIYDRNKEELKMLSNMDIDVKLKESDNKRKLMSERGTDTIPDMISECLKYSESKDIDYIIITNKTLAPAFTNLIEWKRKKGLNAAVIPLYNIYAAYSSAEYTSLTKIKKCIQTLKEQRNLKYVLLGGDVSIVPSIQAYGQYDENKNDKNYDESIPADIFFTCFEGDYEWDANKNGIYGEIDDNIVFKPEVTISRLPLSTNEDITNFTEKLVSYESQQGEVCSIDSFLLAAAPLDTIKYNGHYNIYHFNNQIINDYIKPFWNGSCVRVYESLNDLNNGIPLIIDRKYFSSLLNMSFSFVNLICHGLLDSFLLDSNRYFSKNDVINLNSKIGTVFFTTSCNTNNFRNVVDNYHSQCMSAEMLRNKNFGIISYIGSCSLGVYVSDSGQATSISGSDLFNAKIIRHLFSYDLNTRKLGKIICEIKKEDDLYSQYYSDYRWTELTQCVSGDCEMDVYTKSPISFENVQLNNISGRYVSIDSKDVYNIKIGKKNSYGVFEFSSPRLINPPTSETKIKTFIMPDTQFAVSLTGDNHIPLYFIYNKNTFQRGMTTFLQSREIDEDMDILTRQLTVGRAVHRDENLGDVVFRSGISVDIKSEYTTLCEGTLIEQGCMFTINNIKF